jgi:hypothetical protein
MEAALTYDVSKSRVEECLDSAKFWTDEIGGYGQRMRERADFYAILSAILSAVTSLGVWSTVAASTRPIAIVAVSSIGVLAAVVAIIPTIKGYGGCAEKAAALAPEYAHVKGDLMDALTALHDDPKSGKVRANNAVKDFEKIKREKDALRPFPEDLEKKRKRKHH